MRFFFFFAVVCASFFLSCGVESTSPVLTPPPGMLLISAMGKSTVLGSEDAWAKKDEESPRLTASFDYGLSGLGGTQFQRGAGFPGPIIGRTDRNFFSVLGDIFSNQYPNWTASLNVSYPLGHTQQAANLARAQRHSPLLRISATISSAPA